MENNRDTYLAKLNTLLGLPATARAAYTGKLVHVPFRRSLEQCLEAAYRQRPDRSGVSDISGKSGDSERSR